jgi:hypothetical protein
MMERESKPWDRLRAMEGRIVLMNRRCSEIGGGRTGTRGYNMLREEDLIWHPANVYTWFMWLKSFPDIEKLVIPYRTAEFNRRWKDLLDEYPVTWYFRPGKVRHIGEAIGIRERRTRENRGKGSRVASEGDFRGELLLCK